ncbi:spore coat protein [Marinitoga sp. 1154]|uniref:N-acetylneuraminate synthase family protein n=1 Tax=Marinitoga sp. 1154 TaxID=1643335 RepID=UPI001585DD2E|nr:N-acetylneuraminate synthase family protein [Marinitoga sp. 1154]NUU99879.1 spore coat protein [Marinitoga sp. 1154]
MIELFKKPLFVFEMANNHQGNVEHGKRIIREIKKVVKEFENIFDFAFKFQYRDLDTFIHPDYKNDFSYKYIKRFSETKLSESQFLELKDELEKNEFITMCTPFDENSVKKVIKHNYDIIKVASASFTDWPLLEEISKYDKPIIASTAGATLNEIRNVIYFFKHRGRNINIMHCVAAYPTTDEKLELNQIDLLKNEFPDINVGFSTHEKPDNFDAIKIAIAKGATIFEKHVGVETDKIKLNAYSANPEQVYKWLKSAKKAYIMSGVRGKRYSFSKEELTSLKNLRRGIFALKNISKGQCITMNEVFFAIPRQNGQYASNDMSKYKKFVAKKDIKAYEPISENNVEIKDLYPQIKEYVREILDIVRKSNVVIPENSVCELSHHYGLDNFKNFGAAIIDIINREYCKKIIILLPGQKHPEHYHKQKEETFNVLYGDFIINIDGQERVYKPGDIIIVERNKKHSFYSETGAVIEEISTTHFKNDSFYSDKKIQSNKHRKTQIYLTEDILSY